MPSRYMINICWVEWICGPLSPQSHLWQKHGGNDSDRHGCSFGLHTDQGVTLTFLTLVLCNAFHSILCVLPSSQENFLGFYYKNDSAYIENTFLIYICSFSFHSLVPRQWMLTYFPFISYPLLEIYSGGIYWVLKMFKNSDQKKLYFFLIICNGCGRL